MTCPPKTLAIALAALSGLLLALTGTPASPAAQQAASPAPPAAPQQGAPGQRGGISVNVQLVVVPVTVKDAHGDLVGDVRQDEFRIFEDGVEQRISLFSVETAPLSAIILIDEGMKPKTAQQLQKSLVAMAGGFSGSDEVALSRFDAFYNPILDFTLDHDQLITQLKRVDLSSSEAGVGTTISSGSQINVTPIPGSPTGAPQAIRVTVRKRIDDAVYEAAQALRARDRSRRKLIVLVSNGVNAKNNTHTYDQTLRLLLSSDISVYAVGVEVPLVGRKASVLTAYAHATGGDIYYASDQAELSRIYAQVGEQSRHQYTLGYTPSDTTNKNDYRPIEVRIRRPGLTLETRDGYYPVPRQ